MGKESRLPKERLCHSCEGMMYVSAKGVAEHAKLCRRAKDAGLVLPGSIQPIVRQKPKWS